ncbi:MAG: SdrD B-like domain-containing protein [Saprospiraceae bacterium]
MAGVQVTLYDDNTGAAAVVSGLTNPMNTDANGDYSFEDLPVGGYYLVFSNPGYEVSVGGADCDIDVNETTFLTYTLSAGQSITNVDAGYFLFGTVGDYVWVDEDADGLQNDPDGLDGIDVSLDGTDGLGNTVSMSTTTSGGGAYQFDDVPPGAAYVVTFSNNLPDYNYTYFEVGGATN